MRHAVHMVNTVTRPGKGKPQTAEQQQAVMEMEREVVRRHGIRGEGFASIERELGITNADRIYKRAMEQRPAAERETAAKTQAMRLEALHEKAWTALATDGLDGLADRIATILCDRDPEGDETSDAIPSRVRDVISAAYADTYRGIDAALKVSDRAVKLHGLDHAARIADARLELDQATVQVWAGALVTALGLLDVPTADKRRVVERWGELVAGEVEDPDS